jgi:hypothetical protein
MAIVVEDGTGLANSNSYISEAELTTYATDRGITLVGTASANLLLSMDYIEQQPFKGYKYTDEQALQWPRGNVWIDGYEVDTDEIPQLLRDAQAEFAIAIDAGNNPLATESRATKKEKVGDLEVEYMDGARNSTYVAAGESKLTKLLTSGSGGLSVPAIRG